MGRPRANKTPEQLMEDAEKVREYSKQYYYDNIDRVKERRRARKQARDIALKAELERASMFHTIAGLVAVFGYDVINAHTEGIATLFGYDAEDTRLYVALYEGRNHTDILGQAIIP